MRGRPRRLQDNRPGGIGRRRTPPGIAIAWGTRDIGRNVPRGEMQRLAGEINEPDQP
jgi:hypothetical protein